jgi:hypothetical protein
MKIAQHVTPKPRNGTKPLPPVASFEEGDREAVEQVTKERATPGRLATDVPKPGKEATNNERDGTSTGVIINMTRDMSTISCVVVTISNRLVTS